MSAVAAVATASSTLELTDVGVRIGKAEILLGATASFEAGEFVVLLGPNGAGKSTLLKAVAGLLDARGRIEIGGRGLKSFSLADRARQMSYLPQGGDIHWPLSVRDIVRLGRLPYGAASGSMTAGDHAAVENAMSRCDVLRLGSRLANTLSGGERMRVLLARALAVQAPILLADEPLTSLDPAHQIDAMRLLSEEAARGRTVLAVIHDVALACRFATRIVAIQQGVIMADGRAEELLESGALSSLFGLDFEQAHTASGSSTIVARLDSAAARPNIQNASNH